MRRSLLAAFATLVAASAAAAVDANRASQAELEAVKGVGTVLSTVIVDARKSGEFKDWNDFIARVQGVGGRGARRLSDAGLTIQGKPYAGSAPADPVGASAAVPALASRPASAAAPASTTPRSAASAPAT